jgi:hypothetical protein
MQAEDQASGIRCEAIYCLFYHVSWNISSVSAGFSIVYNLQGLLLKYEWLYRQGTLGPGELPAAVLPIAWQALPVSGLTQTCQSGWLAARSPLQRWAAPLPLPPPQLHGPSTDGPLLG